MHLQRPIYCVNLKSQQSAYGRDYFLDDKTRVKNDNTHFVLSVLMLPVVICSSAKKIWYFVNAITTKRAQKIDFI